MTNLPYRNRHEAGRKLARHLVELAAWEDPLALALPRGGAPVAAEVAVALNAELDVLVVRKIGLPWQPEVAMGAIASGGICVRNEAVVHALGISDRDFDRVMREEKAELRRRERRYRGDRGPIRIQNRTVIVVDDGLATGSTMQAAVAALREADPLRILVAVPVGARESVEVLRRDADEVICPETPEPFGAISAFYDDFSQVSDGEVETLLAAARKRTRAVGLHHET